MWKNYLKVALRHIKRHKGYALINVSGLALGIACCTLIVLFVMDELRFDRFHENAEDVYRVVTRIEREGGLQYETATSPLVLGAIVDDAHLPQVEHTTRILRYSVFTSPVVNRPGETGFRETGLYFVDSTFFDVFSFELIRGDAETVLDEPLSIVLTESAARKYFGDENPLGRTLISDGVIELTVTGVAQDPPENSHFRFDMLGSFSSLGQAQGTWVYTSWHWPPVYTYVRAGQFASGDEVLAQIDQTVANRVRPDLVEQTRFSLQPLTSIHLHSNLDGELAPNSDVTYVYLFSAVAFFILLLACINFMNLATARAARRAREVGMRKALGAHRRQLIRQFLSESMLTAVLALIGALLLVVVALPVFNDVTGKAIVLGTLAQWTIPLALIVIVLFVGVLAGSYPALYLSRFQPAEALKDSLARGGSVVWMRKGLVVFQFAISCALLFGTAVVYQQLKYVQDVKLGFDKERIVVVTLDTDEAQTGFEALKQRWLQHPNIASTSATSDVPPSTEDLYDFPIVLRGARADSLEMLTLTIDHDFAETFAIDVVEGRDLSREFPTDAGQGFLLNESAVRRLGLDDPVGQELTIYHYAGEPEFATGRVVGVLQDFHYESLRSGIDPIAFYILPTTNSISYYNYLSVRIGPGDLEQTLAHLEREWNEFQPGRPFVYHFLDDEFDALYRAEQRLGTLFTYFSGLAIFIACLGLFGLASYTAEQRTKEIGLRKVLGASIGSILLLLSKDFVRLVLIAFVVGAPLAYVVMQRWLEGFAYRTEVAWWLFPVIGLAAVLIALGTVGWQSLRAARANPVKALKYE